MAAAVDWAVVRIPAEADFFGKHYGGSPLTAGIRAATSKVWAQRQMKRWERRFTVPYDARYPSDTRHAMADGAVKEVEGLRPAVHRLQSLGHDPVLAVVFGARDLMGGQGTYLDSHGRYWRVPERSSRRLKRRRATWMALMHLVTDIGTKQGLPAPLFGVLQRGQYRSPFVLSSTRAIPRDAKPRAYWTDVSRYMYVNGYDLRHLAVAAIAPGLVEGQIRAYWWATKRWRPGLVASERRLAELLLTGHLVALGGNLAKTRLGYGGNPSALNLPQLAATPLAAAVWLGTPEAHGDPVPAHPSSSSPQ